MPSGVIYAERQLSAEQAGEIQERWLAARRNNRKPAVISGAKFEPLSIKPEESQFVESQRLNVASIARIYGVPPELIAGESGGSLTYASVEQRALDFLTFSVRPWLVRVERAVSALLPRTQVARFNAGGLVRTSLKERYEAHETGIRAGFLLPNEARDLEDMAPLPAPTPGGAVA